ncbi:MAG: FtsX-like permease family protein, partial [Blastocatellia bacterium]
LGATSGEIFKLVLLKGLLPAATGGVLGLAGAMALTRLMSGLLFEVSPTDPVTFSVIAAVLALVTLAACYLPARRATATDPIVALKYE